MRKFSLMTLALLMALSLIAAPSFHSATAQDMGEPLKIGVLTDLSAALQLYGVELDNGLTLGLQYATDGTLEIAGSPG